MRQPFLSVLGNEGREQFAHGGGDPALYRVCACLNHRPEWIQTMADLVTAQAPTKP